MSSILFSQEFEINGKIIDEKKSPIQYAEIVLLTRDSIAIKSELSDNQGYFSIKNKAGSYIIQIKNFKSTSYSRDINLHSNISIGNISIRNTNQIKEVILTKRKKLIEKKVDRLVFNVENSISATGGDALDALKLTPGIRLQNETLSMIGKGSMILLLDDRPVQMSGDDLINYLKTIKSDDLKSIEVITNPPSKYTAEGNSGVLNIITKKAKKDAWSSTIRGVYQQATYATGSTSGSFNLQKNRLTLVSSLSYNNGSNAPIETSIINYPAINWNEISKRRDFTNTFSAKAGLDYKISDKITHGIIYNYISSRPLIKDYTQSKLFNSQNQSLDSLILNTGRDKSKRNSHTFNYHFIYAIDTTGKKLSIDADLLHFTLDKDRKYTTERVISDPNYGISNNLTANRNSGSQNINNYSVNIDMEHPLQWLNLNYGGRVSFIKTTNNYNFFNINPQGNEYSDTDLSNSFEYYENTQAIYISAQKKISEKWETKAGLRLENTQTKGYSQTLHQTNRNNYSKLFPTFYLIYTPDETNAISINYGLRINRPNYNYLNPFRWVTSPYSYSEGNPFLNPSFIHNLELEYSYKDKLITNIFYSELRNGFEQLAIINPETNIQQVVPQNFIMNKTFGINQLYIFKIFKSWNINVNGSVYYSSTDSKTPVTLQYLKGWNGEFNITNDIALNKSKTILLSANYRLTTKGVDNLDYNSYSNQLNASLKMLFFDKRLILNVYGNDILSSNRPTYTTFSNGIRKQFRNYYDERYFRLSISYNFGKAFKKENYTNKNQNEIDRTE